MCGRFKGASASITTWVKNMSYLAIIWQKFFCMYYFKQLFYSTIQSPYVPCLALKKSNLVSQPLILHVDHLLCKWRTKLRFIILSTVFVTFMNEMPQLGSSPFDICKRMWCVWREDGCVSVCWGSWNSIKQMDLLRVSSLLPKKGPNMPLSLANRTQQYAEHISIWPFTCFLLFSFCFASMSSSRWRKQNTPEPLSWPQNEPEKQNRAALWVSRERRKREPSARGFYSRDYSARLDSEGESRSRQLGPRRRKERAEMIHLYCGSLRVG